MILMAYGNPSQANSFRYKIGWNLNTSGIAIALAGTTCGAQGEKALKKIKPGK